MVPCMIFDLKYSSEPSVRRKQFTCEYGTCSLTYRKCFVLEVHACARTNARAYMLTYASAHSL